MTGIDTLAENSRARGAKAPRAALGLALLALAACGGPPGDATDARGAVETLLSACAEGKPTVVLESLTEPARRAFARGRSTGEGCNDALGLGLATAPPEEAAKPFEEARVGTVEASGGIARATIEAGPERSEVEIERVGGRWLVNNPAVSTD
jgi:hypothetical protein